MSFRRTSIVSLLAGPGLALALGAALIAAPSSQQPVSPKIALVATTQSASLYMYPQLASAGTYPASATAAYSSMMAKFRPIRSGRKVSLQQYRSGSWVGIQTRAQNGSGIVEFNAPYLYSRKPAKYRAVAVRGGGLAAKATASKATNVWGAPDFREQFAGSAYSTTRWSERTSTYSKGDRTCSRVESGPGVSPTVGSGVARIKVVSDPTPPKNSLGQVRSCVIDGRSYGKQWRTANSLGTKAFNFRYGFAAARLKLHPHAGVHSSFWLTSATSSREEIDTLEYFGNRDNDNTEMQNGMFDFSSGTAKKYGGYVKDTWKYGRDWYSKFHVFSVEWRPGRLVFRIDGKVTRTISGSMVSDHAMIPVLSAHSSDFEYGQITNTQLPQVMQADWVQVWDLSPTT
jgi:hypothetical protein